MKKPALITALVAALALLAGCTDGYEERGLCSYLGTCEIGYCATADCEASLCKELGTCHIGLCTELGGCPEDSNLGKGWGGTGDEN